MDELKKDAAVLVHEETVMVSVSTAAPDPEPKSLALEEAEEVVAESAENTQDQETPSEEEIRELADLEEEEKAASSSSLNEDLLGEDTEHTDAAEKQGTVLVVGVRFRTAGRIYYFSPGTLPVKRSTRVIVETTRGLECGTCVCDPMEVERRKVKSPLRTISRLATEEDLKREVINRAKEKEAYRVCAEKIRKHGLDMKLIDAEYTFDGNKILFYFTADGRVDFRDLVKDLAGIFRMRIELRQIGVRDETRILGGYGICGRPLCCHAYLTDFAPVSIKMAKEQNLSLNPAKISGVCGRLMCCLKNEEETYEELNKNLPRIGDEVQAADGLVGEVESVNVLRQRVRIIVEANDEKELHEYEAGDVTITRRRKRGQAKPKFHRGEGTEVKLDGTKTGGTRKDAARPQRTSFRDAVTKDLQAQAEAKAEAAEAAAKAPAEEKMERSERGIPGSGGRGRRRRNGAPRPDAPKADAGKPDGTRQRAPQSARPQRSPQSQMQDPGERPARPNPGQDKVQGARQETGEQRTRSHDRRRSRRGAGKGPGQQSNQGQKPDAGEKKEGAVKFQGSRE